jgi:hypothetical protein
MSRTSAIVLAVLALICLGIGAFIGFSIADMRGKRTLEAWERASLEQREAQRAHDKRLLEETTRGLLDDRARLWARLRAGWQPTIPGPAPGGMPAGGAPDDSAGASGAAGTGVPAAAGDAGVCAAERQRLIEDGQAAMIKCRRMRSMLRGLAEPVPQ